MRISYIIVGSENMATENIMEGERDREQDRDREWPRDKKHHGDRDRERCLG